MGPLIVIVAGLLALAGAFLVLRSFGSGYRVGRLLASTPSATFEEAESLAAGGTRRYVRIAGRLDSAADFPDENARPLVYRRRRLEAQRAGRWTVIDESVEVVPFEVREGLSALAIDTARLGDGLVVLPRESVGTAADVPERVPSDLPSTTPLRYRVEQVSAVEHATVLGVPERRSDGTIALTAGLGRPLILSTLEPTEAMQLLAGGRRRRPLAAFALLAAGLGLLAIGLAWTLVVALVAAILPGPVLGDSPSPTPGTGGDTRSVGEGPGLVGSPLLAIGIVLAIAALSVVASLIYVRATAGRRPGRSDRS
ncbi:MAG: hypothetical protein QOF11_2534 [Chloroflexota bacterium]|nr:hypothetical protein [Chloroflexota bacterium]